jgi:hypothetical protein
MTFSDLPFVLFQNATQEADIRNQVWCFRCAVKNGWIDTNYPTNMCERQLPDFPGC